MSEAFAYEHVCDEFEKYEMIDGEVYMMSRPSFEHGNVEVNIAGIFRRYLKGKRCRAFSEPNVRLSEKDYVIPDVAIVCNPDILNDPWIEGTPDLIVEILSPSTARRDKLVKLALYEKYGVKEYWIVSPTSKSIEVYRLIDGKLKLTQFCIMYHDYEWKEMTDEQKATAEVEQLSIKVSLYDDFIVKLEDVFEDID